MRLDRLTNGQKLAAVAALALPVVMFFPWYGRSPQQDQDFGVSVTAWRVFDSLDLLLLAVAVVVGALAWLAASGRELVRPPWGDAIVACLGLVAAVLVFFNLIDTPFELDRKYGLYLGLVAAIGVAAGGWLSLRDRGESLAGLRGRVESGVGEARDEVAKAIAPDGRGRTRRRSGGGRRRRTRSGRS